MKTLSLFDYVTSFGIPFLHWLEREFQCKRLAVIYNRSMTPLSEGVPRTQTYIHTGPAQHKISSLFSRHKW